MKLKVNVKRTKDVLTKALKDLNGEGVEVGHFKDQGKHSNSELTYAELMAVHNNPQGHGLDWPARPVLDILEHQHRNLSAPEIKKLLKKYLENNPSEKNNEKLLEGLGEFLREEEKKIFGSAQLAANASSTVEKKGRNEPLVDSSELKNKTAYRTSKSKIIKEG